MLHFLKQANWKWQWKQFENLPKQKQTLEAVGTFFASWFQTEEDELKKECETMLDVIAEHVMEVLKNYNASHPLFNVSQDLRDQWKDGHLTENQFDVKDSKEILQYLSLVLFELREFRVQSYAMSTGEALNINGLVMYVSYSTNLLIDRLGLYMNEVSYSKGIEARNYEWRNSIYLLLFS